MEALNLALDITLVGALALPWVMLVFHLFFTSGEDSIPVLLRWIRKLNQPAAVAVVLFATAYFLGSVVSRMSQDFFNDGDLHVSDRDLRLKTDMHHTVLRVGATENRIITGVYCEHLNLLPVRTVDPTLTALLNDFQTNAGMCDQVLRWISYIGPRKEEEDENLTDSAALIFHLQESALLLKGEDATFRLRQLRYQVIVLRGAAFNGLIAFALCLFSVGGRIRCGKPDSRWRWAGAVFPGTAIIVTFIASSHHFWAKVIHDPPFMEFTLAVIAGTGVLLFFMQPRESTWKKAKKTGDPPDSDDLKEAPPKSPEDLKAAQWKACKRWLLLTGISGLLTVSAILAWWSTDQMYTEEVVYSYSALNAPQK